jgi:phospholipase C
MPSISCASRTLSVAAFVLFLSACGANSGLAVSPGLPTASSSQAFVPNGGVHRGPSSGKIKHIVIIVQENRSFNNLFRGYPGAETADYGADTYGHRIKLLPIGLETSWDLDHSSNSFFEACNGTGTIPGTNCRMNGFNREWVGCYSNCPIKHPQYAYVPRTETEPYFDIAEEFVLADQMYASNFDASSFISHQYIISGRAGAGPYDAVNYPYGSWGCPGGSSDMISMVGPQRQIPYGNPEVVCWDPKTLGDELDAAKLPWAFYATSYSGYITLWSAYQAINHIYNGPDWSKDVFSDKMQFFNDISNGKLRAVSWITPTCANSDHAGCGSNTGPSWVTSLVNAIGTSKYWDSTATFIFWDDYGGWYDPQPPAYVDYDGLGLRLGMLIVSAYAKKGYVTHTHLEHGSILKFVEDTFGLPPMAASDKRANLPSDAFDFSAPPRKFAKIEAPYDLNYFKHQPPDNRIPDWE